MRIAGPHEGAGIGEADLRQVQDRAAAWGRACDLFEPEAQAAAGVMMVVSRWSLVVERNRRLPRQASWPRAAGPRTAHPNQCADEQGAAQGRDREEEDDIAES